MKSTNIITDNPELIQFINDKLHITVLGGIKFTGLDRLKVTLKIVKKDNVKNVFRHNLDLYNSIQTGQLVERAADFLDITTIDINEAINHLTTALENYRADHLESLKPKPQEVKQLSESERKAAIAFLKSPQLLKQTAEAISRSGIIGEETDSVIAYLIYTSRKRRTPLHLMCLGASGTGKTWLQEKVGELIPEEDKLEITTLTTNAFYYFGKDELKYKLLLIEDLDGAENVMYPLRELQSKRRISKTVTLKDSKGNMKTVTLNVEGPVCVSGCTTREQLYEDNANRCVLLYMDNTPEQDKRIMDYQRNISAGLVDQFEERKVREQIKNVQRVLKPISVRNPYATYLQLPDAVFKPRRTMMLLLLFVETITYYHQYQRELKTDFSTGEQYIESTVEDITAAFELLETTLLKKSDELSNACRSFFERLKVHLKAQDATTFHSREIRSVFRVSSSSLKRYLTELERILLKQYNFFTSSLYNGLDIILDSPPQVIMISVFGDTKTYLDPYTDIVQILGRFRSTEANPDGIYDEAIHLLPIYSNGTYKSKGAVTTWLKAQQDVYNNILTMLYSTTNHIEKSTYHEVLRRLPFNNYLIGDSHLQRNNPSTPYYPDKEAPDLYKLNYFLVDNLFEEERVNSYFSNVSNLIEAYRQAGIVVEVPDIKSFEVYLNELEAPTDGLQKINLRGGKRYSKENVMRLVNELRDLHNISGEFELYDRAVDH